MWYGPATSMQLPIASKAPVQSYLVNCGYIRTLRAAGNGMCCVTHLQALYKTHCFPPVMML